MGGVQNKIIFHLLPKLTVCLNDVSFTGLNDFLLQNESIYVFNMR